MLGKSLPLFSYHTLVLMTLRLCNHKQNLCFLLVEFHWLCTMLPLQLSCPHFLRPSCELAHLAVGDALHVQEDTELAHMYIFPQKVSGKALMSRVCTQGFTQKSDPSPLELY